MPIHLPPLSRRRFIATTLAAGAGLVFSKSLLAAEKKVDENCWALFSDIHIAADPTKTARGTNMTDNFKAATKEVLALPQRPAGLLISGDCSFNSGEEADYAAVTGLLRPLRESGMPIDLTLGNHDDRPRFLSALVDPKDAQLPLPDHHVFIIRTPRANMFVLDSLEKTLSTPGILGETQLAWLTKELDANKDKPAIVVAHHNLTLIGDKKMSLRDTDKLLEIIRPRKQVKAYVFGHTHNWEHKEDESGIHLVNLPPVAYVFNEHRPSGWTLATIEPNGAKFELHCLDHAHKENGQVFDLKWRAA